MSVLGSVSTNIQKQTILNNLPVLGQDEDKQEEGDKENNHHDNIDKNKENIVDLPAKPVSNSALYTDELSTEIPNQWITKESSNKFKKSYENSDIVKTALKKETTTNSNIDKLKSIESLQTHTGTGKHVSFQTSNEDKKKNTIIKNYKSKNTNTNNNKLNKKLIKIYKDNTNEKNNNNNNDIMENNSKKVQESIENIKIVFENSNLNELNLNDNKMKNETIITNENTKIKKYNINLKLNLIISINSNNELSEPIIKIEDISIKQDDLIENTTDKIENVTNKIKNINLQDNNNNNDKKSNFKKNSTTTTSYSFYNKRKSIYKRKYNNNNNSNDKFHEINENKYNNAKN
ncbi:unnamed protein product [[Candida] boidinii]|uniref:Unnamed protein product n=1 Tax=Candida boidinii TaxID=5477 RepID=A0ACB5TFP4_CANBO|nr:unnamed protein product [[Candida] boidinii]GME91277.1 unnamed protein product [[Candida] boidinii]